MQTWEEGKLDKFYRLSARQTKYVFLQLSEDGNMLLETYR